MTNEQELDELAGLAERADAFVSDLMQSDDLRGFLRSLVGQHAQHPFLADTDPVDLVWTAIVRNLTGNTKDEAYRGMMQTLRAIRNVDALADAAGTRGARHQWALDAARAALALKRDGDELAADEIADELAEPMQREAAAFRAHLRALMPTEVDPHLRERLRAGAEREGDAWWFMLVEPRLQDGRWVTLPWRVDVPDGEGWPPGLVGRAVPRLSLELARFLAERDHKDLATAWLTQEAAREDDRAASPPLADGLAGPLLPGWIGRSDDPARAFVVLALVAWEGLRPAVELRNQRRARTITAAIESSLYVTLFDQPAAPVGNEIRHYASPVRLAPSPAMDGEALARLEGFIAGLKDLPGVDARRTMTWMARVAWEADTAGSHGGSGDGWHAARQLDGSVVIVIDGGEQHLAELVGIASHKARRVPLRFLKALSYLHLTADGPDGAHWSGSLVYAVECQRGAPGRPGRVTITLSPWWAPGAIQALPRTSRRRLVPVIDVPDLDGVTGLNRKQHGAAAALEAAAVVRLSQHSDELAAIGSVAFDWHAEGAERGLSSLAVAALVTALVDAGRWAEVTAGRWTLGDAEAMRPALALLTEGGARREASKARGRKPRRT